MTLRHHGKTELAMSTLARARHRREKCRVTHRNKERCRDTETERHRCRDKDRREEGKRRGERRNRRVKKEDK